MPSSILLLFAIVIILLGAGTGFLFSKIRTLDALVSRLLGHGEAEGGEADTQSHMVRRVASLETTAGEHSPRIAELEQTAAVSIQKIGFMRFNPFQDTGGDQSFVIAMLDRSNNGVLLSSLYMREGMRLYGKSIERGRSKHVLSEEEKKLLEETIKK